MPAEPEALFVREGETWRPGELARGPWSAGALHGEAPSPLQRVAAAADFGNGISAALPFGAWRFINPDLTIYLARLPRGEWVCLDAVTWLGPEGAGVAESALFDEDGRLGRSLQSLLLERASGKAAV